MKVFYNIWFIINFRNNSNFDKTMASKKVSAIKQQATIMQKKQNAVSTMLVNETKKMEEKLELVK